MTTIEERIPSPTLSPHSTTPSPTPSSSEADYSKIELTAGRIALNIIFGVFTAGLYLAYQSWRLQKALQCGKVEVAQKAIEKGGWWLYKHTVNSDDFRSLALTNEIDSIQLIAAQILFDSESATGGSSAAEAFIIARDQNDVDYDKLTILKEILPYTALQETTLDTTYAAVTDSPERIFVHQVRRPKKDRFTDDYLSHILSYCRENIGCTVDTFIQEVYERIPSWKESESEPLYRAVLRKFYRKKFNLLQSSEKA